MHPDYVPRRAYPPRGGPIRPETGISVPRRAYPSRGGPIRLLLNCGWDSMDFADHSIHTVEFAGFVGSTFRGLRDQIFTA